MIQFPKQKLDQFHVYPMLLKFYYPIEYQTKDQLNIIVRRIII